MNEDEWNGAVIESLSEEWAEKIIFLPECGSTNDEARKLASKGAADFSVVLTEIQTSGRGRRGQPWTCPPGEGMACSVIVRPDDPPALWSRIALATGLAVSEALDSFGCSSGVKWPNDVWINEQKVCGILVEAGDGFVVVGIGLNVNVTCFPEGLAFPATSLALEVGTPVSREDVLVACLNRLRVRIAQIGSSFPELLEAWGMRCVLRGKEVSLMVGDEVKRGTVVGLSPGGELILMTASGRESLLQASEIRVIGE